MQGAPGALTDTGPAGVLLIERTPGSLEPIRPYLSGRRQSALPLAQAAKAPDLISRERIGLAFCDLDGADAHSVCLLQQIHRLHPHLPLIPVLQSGAWDAALEAFRNGATDVLFHPLAATGIERSLVRIRSLCTNQQAAARQQQRVSRSLDDLILLKAIGATTSSEEDLQRLLDRVVEAIQTALRVDIVSLMLCNDHGRLEIRAARGLPPEIISATQVTSGEGVAGFVLASGEPVLIDNLESDGRFSPSTTADRYRSGSLLSVPIRTHDRLLGVLNVNNKHDGTSFAAADQELLMMIAHQAALAIENLKLVGRLRAQSLELEQAHADLLRLHDERTRLVCNLSHELKTPLTSILGFADLLLNFFAEIDEVERQDYLGRIHAESLQLERLINGMLRLFAIDSGGGRWHWEPLALRPCLDEVLARHALAAAELDLAVEVIFADGLPDIWGDRDKLLLLLDALVDNAVKFNCAGGRLQVRAENREVDGIPHVYLTMANDGRKVRPEQADEIFRQCSQLGDLNTDKPRGIGIGLATCRAILRQMHGRIFLEPAAGWGTCLGLLLPVHPIAEEVRHAETGYR